MVNSFPNKDDSLDRHPLRRVFAGSFNTLADDKNGNAGPWDGDLIWSEFVFFPIVESGKKIDFVCGFRKVAFGFSCGTSNS